MTFPIPSTDQRDEAADPERIDRTMSTPSATEYPEGPEDGDDGDDGDGDEDQGVEEWDRP